MGKITCSYCKTIDQELDKDDQVIKLFLCWNIVCLNVFNTDCTTITVNH